MSSVSALDQASYQRAVRTVLANPVISETYPDAGALPLVRRWADELRTGLSEVFGYRLELSRSTARLIRTADTLDPTVPARSATNRPFDRKRYAYLALTVAVLSRAGTQIALSELATAVAADAGRIEGLGLDTERGADRAAFVDAVAWLEVRGALRLADGSARRWADDPDLGEALYDIDRDVAYAVYRPSAVLQHVRSVSALLGVAGPGGRRPLRREAAQRARRALVERPVVYFDEVDESLRNVLRAPHAAADVERMTGLVAERRAEGIALLDSSGGFSDRRFPGTGTVAQTALLLISEIADRIENAEPDELPRLAAPEWPGAEITVRVDSGLPSATVLDELATEPSPNDDDADGGVDNDGGGDGDGDEAAQWRTHPLLTDGWLAERMNELMQHYGTTFATQWRADPERLLARALDLLAELRMVARVPGGVLALPLLARYRNAVLRVRRRKSEPSLFESSLFDT